MDRCEWCNSSKLVQSTTNFQADKVGPSLCAVCRGYPPLVNRDSDEDNVAMLRLSKTNFVSWNLYVISATHLLSPRSY